MKRTVFLLLVAAVIVSSAVALSVYFRKNGIRETAALKVGATVIPVESIVKAVGKEKVDVVLIVSEGQSPHTFDPSPETIKRLSGAEVVFKIGLIDDWVDSIAEGLNINRFEVSDNIWLKGVSEAVVIGGKENKESYDPHYWLSAANGKKMAENIARKLSELDPENTEYYSNNLAAFLFDADKTDNAVKEILSVVKGKKIITFHDAWNYFADEYGLEIVAVYQPSPGKEPSPGDIRDLIDTAKKFGIKVFFSEEQYSPAPLMAIGKEEGITVLSLNPLGKSGYYLDSLVENAKKIKNALLTK